MKVSFFPPRIPKALDWRWARWLFGAGFLFILRAAIASRLHDKPEAVVAWVGVGLLFFAAAYRGRAERFYRALTERPPAAPDTARLQAVGLATAGFIHELKNAVTVLHGYGQLASRAAEDEGVSERLRALLHEIDSQAERLGAALRRDLELASPAPSTTRRPIAECFDEMAQLLNPIARHRSIAFESAADPGIDRAVYDPDFRQALLNLGLNAIGFARETVRLRLTREGDAAVVTVEDDGPGIDAALAPKLFEPFAPGRPGGTGLGLAQVRAAVEREGGTVHAEQSPSGGARLVIRLPPAVATPPT